MKEAISFGRIRTTTIGEEVAVAEQDVRELAKGQEVMVVRRETFKHLLVARCKHVVVFAKGAAVANVVTMNFIVANRTPKRWHEWYKKCGSLW